MKRRLKWEIFDESRFGVIVTDLDSEEFATGSHRFEVVARRIALHRLEHRPSGGKRPGERRCPLHWVQGIDGERIPTPVISCARCHP